MIEDLRELGAGPPIEADLCLIGAGAAGITIARALSGSGLAICLAESGGLDFEAQTQALYDGDTIGLQEQGMEIGRLRFFGGTTNHWGGRCTPLAPLDFTARPWVPYSGWPITRRELDPYYQRARAVCGLDGPAAPEAMLSSVGVRPPLVAPALEVKIWEHTPEHWSFGTVYRQALRQAGDVRVLLHANLTGMAATPARNAVTAITVKTLTGIAREIRAPCYVLCCGAIENARQLLSTADGSITALGNGCDLVGRFYMDHFRGQVATLVTGDPQPEVEAVFNYFIAPGQRLYQVGLELSAAAQSEQRLLNASAVLDYEGDPRSGIAEAQAIWRALQQGQWGPDIGERLWRVLSDMDGVASMIRRRLIDGRHPVMPLKAGLIIADIEQGPNPESRVSLADERDALGGRRARLDWRAGALERRTAEYFARVIGAALLRLGFGRCRVEPWLMERGTALALGETYHQSGTTRMADDPRRGVVDADCRLHGVANLYVAGSSVFPSGGHANPTLTIVALALRLADHLKAVVPRLSSAAG
jgi:choline dehydrogenase-like flavoprotein